MAVWRPVRAGCCAPIEIGAVETDKGDTVGLKMPDEFGVAVLKADEKLGTVRLDEIANLADKPLRRVWDGKRRIPEHDIGGGHTRGEPQIPHQPIFLDVLQARSGDWLILQHQRAV